MSLNETILPRDLHLMPQDTHEENWFEGDPMRTTYCDALSIFFPEGERFFIRSVKRYVNQIDDPKLREEVKLFCIQEAFHTREHEVYNAKLFENTSPHYRNLWTWHALEETEHKGVAFDVYKVVTQHLSPWKDDDGKLIKAARSRLDTYLKPTGLNSKNA